MTLDPRLMDTGLARGTFDDDATGEATSASVELLVNKGVGLAAGGCGSVSGEDCKAFVAGLLTLARDIA